MQIYLITYGADNQMATFEADDKDHAIELFVDWEPVGPDDETNKEAINEIYICTKID